MWLRLDLDGVEMYLRIQGFRKSALPDDDAWCRVSLHLQSPWLHYDLDEHILCSEEVKWLSKTIEDAFDKRLPKNEELEFIEPNIRFIFSCLDAEGELTRPPMADLQVFFWNGQLPLPLFRRSRSRRAAAISAPCDGRGGLKRPARALLAGQGGHFAGIWGLRGRFRLQNAVEYDFI